ncbi:hypothetical protein ZIOFF_015052 [Zingiber officinale]|uniref:Uncharacterized protein n=1 Tax=Zingiber officinale TaxID=94328 RepID=A0A8J5HCX6_ZINOF|nr:hypothetical protein ZIOFF_015052 [Zingiber officinale]
MDMVINFSQLIFHPFQSLQLSTSSSKFGVEFANNKTPGQLAEEINRIIKLHEANKIERFQLHFPRWKSFFESFCSFLEHCHFPILEKLFIRIMWIPEELSDDDDQLLEDDESSYIKRLNGAAAEEAFHGPNTSFMTLQHRISALSKASPKANVILVKSSNDKYPFRQVA